MSESFFGAMMKLTVARLSVLTPQDEIDLAKIWPNQSVSHWLESPRALFAASFNDRLLGAVKVTLQGDSAELQDLAVRDVTRRRGVGRYLLEELEDQLPQIKNWRLSARRLSDTEYLLADVFMQACGFRRQGKDWYK